MIVSSNSKTKQTNKKTVSKKTDLNLWLNQKSESEELSNLRPKSIKDYIGQQKLIRQLSLIIESAKIRESLPEHMLFYGQPGLGKTTIAGIVSKELQSNFKVIAAPSLQKTGDLVSLLINLEPKTVLFIDEIHRLRAPLEETLYSAMEDMRIDLLMGKGHTAKTTSIDLPLFTMVGATTQLGKISKPLKDRFASIFQLEPYTHSEILDLVERTSKILNLKMDDDAKIFLCRKCRGVPRIANNLMKRVRDYQLVNKVKLLNKVQIEDIMEDLGIYENGLTKTDVVYLQALYNGTVGLKTLSGILQEESETIETVTEPYLIYLGLIDKSTGGRKLTPKGLDFLSKHVKIKVDDFIV
jgi:Holliday junction DNA helicase RuvB